MTNLGLVGPTLQLGLGRLNINQLHIMMPSDLSIGRKWISPVNSISTSANRTPFSPNKTGCWTH